MLNRDRDMFWDDVVNFFLCIEFVVGLKAFRKQTFTFWVPLFFCAVKWF